MEKNVSCSFEVSDRFYATNMTSQSIQTVQMSLLILIRRMHFDVEKYLAHRTGDTRKIQNLKCMK